MNSQSRTSAGDGSFPDSTISALVALNDGSALFYFRGQTFFNIDGRILKSPFTEEEISNLASSFDELFYPGVKMDFKDFMRHYGPHIAAGGCHMISYLTPSDYLSILKSGIHGRITVESSYVINFLKELIPDEEGMDECLHRLSYDGLSVSFAYGDGVCEINPMEDNYTQVGKHFMLTSPDELRNALLRGMLLYRRVLTGDGMDKLLIDSIPFDIRFGPQWGEMVPLIIGKGISIPTRKSDKLDFAGTDHAAVRIGDMTVRIDVDQAFGYIPKEIEFIVEVDAASVISFTMTDRPRSRSVEYRLSELL